jgi:hypothetical protein
MNVHLGRAPVTPQAQPSGATAQPPANG